MQNKIHISGNSIYWKKFKWGEILKHKSTFLVVPRTEKNVFRLFGRGLGINEEILYLLKDLKIAYIEVPFKDEILKTTVAKWLSKGIPSPFASEKVDPQLILSIDEINPATKPTVINEPSDIVTDKQLSFFEVSYE